MRTLRNENTTLNAAYALALLAASCLIGCGQSSQESAAGEGSPPAPERPYAAQSPVPRTGFRVLDEYRVSRISVFTDDYGELAHYREANAKLPAPSAHENRVVFFGDSITELWALEG